MARSRLVKNPAVVCTELEDGGVLLDLETTAYFSINRTALRIWNLMADASAVDDIASRMTTEFEVDYDHALASAQRLVDTLERERLIRVESA